MPDSLLPIGPDYRIRFHADSDRFQHVIESRSGNSWVALWRSVEGTNVEHWPTSPPWQEIAEHQLGSTTCLLGVGKAGTAHWSISIDVTLPPADSSSGDLPTDPRSAVRFDVACRTKELPKQLGSSYEYRENGGGEAGEWRVDEATTEACADESSAWRCEPRGPRTAGELTTYRWIYYWSPPRSH